MKRKPALLGALLLLVAAQEVLAAQGVLAAADLPRDGEVNERVACAADTQQTYALFLPSSYDASRRWPIVYLFDPGAQGARAVERFRKGAQTYGFVLAASNNSKNGPIAPSLAAARAVWEDTHERLSIDDRRIYTAGFSGGARLATLVAQLLSGSVAGVIACSGGFPDGKPPTRDMPFVHFGTAGDTDFNYSEMRALDATLEKLGRPHRLEIFEGPHQWAPEAICAEALEWMRLREAERGIGSDDAMVEKSFQRRLASAGDAEAQGRLDEALREYRSIVRDFQKFRPVDAIEQKASALEKDPRYRKQLAQQEKRDLAERTAIERLSATLESIRAVADLPPLPRLVSDLEIPEWKKRASASDRDDALSARRVLESLWARAALFLPSELQARKNFAGSILSLSVAIEIKPESAASWYNRACAQALAGRRKKAFEDLRAAAQRGFHDRGTIEGDEDLSSLRADPEFHAILEALPSVTPTPALVPTPTPGPQRQNSVRPSP